MLRKKIKNILKIMLVGSISLAPFCEIRFSTLGGLELIMRSEGEELLQHEPEVAFRPNESLISSIKEAMQAYPVNENTRCALKIGGIKISRQPGIVDLTQDCPVINCNLIFGYLLDVKTAGIMAKVEIKKDNLRIERLQAILPLFEGEDEDGNKKRIGNLRLTSPSYWREGSRMPQLDEFFSPTPVPSFVMHGFEGKSPEEKRQYRFMHTEKAVRPSSLRGSAETLIPNFKSQDEFEVWVRKQRLSQSLERFIEVFGNTRINNWKIALDIIGKRTCFIHSFSQDTNAVRGNCRGIDSVLEFFALFRGSESLDRLIKPQEDAIYEDMGTPYGFEAIEQEIPRILPLIIGKLKYISILQSIYPSITHVTRFVYDLMRFLHDNTGKPEEMLDAAIRASSIEEQENLNKWDLLNAIIYHSLRNSLPQIKDDADL